MGKQDIDNTLNEDDEFESDQDVEDVVKSAGVIQKDTRRRLEDRLDEVRLNRILREYDFRDI